MKQGFYVDPSSRSKKIYDGPRQAEMLTMELNCIGWASALMTCVYEFIKESEAGIGSPPFDVPHMQYVQCGLAISKPGPEDILGLPVTVAVTLPISLKNTLTPIRLVASTGSSST